MHKLCVVVFDDYSDLFGSNANMDVMRDFDAIYKDDHDEDCRDLPCFSPKSFYKKLVYWFEYRGWIYVFVSARMTQQELGRIEHCIYTVTGLRGVGNHIKRLEFLGTPNTPMKKFLLKRC